VWNMLRQKENSESAMEDAIASEEAVDPGFLAQPAFMRMLCLERKRTERSRRRFVLMLLDAGSLLRAGDKTEIFDRLMTALSRSSRETDIKGWYEEGTVLGVIFTEIGDEGQLVASALLAKITKALVNTLGLEQIKEISISFHLFPDDWEGRGPEDPADLTLYPEMARRNGPQKVSRLMKRSMDMAGSLFALLLLSPVLLTIAVAIKATSRGPVLFRQPRLGQHGRSFTFLKFRSMHFANDHRIHEEYVKQFISGKAGVEQTKETPFKLTRDPRITPIGRFLRRTSLDELPQFFNVLWGDMSLVGPRPPIAYEFEAYDIWHKRRLLAVKPGITGLWQVEGRSRVTFDEMVRLDLRYASSWSLWLDLKILLQTPRAVISGAGAV
jgi:lipopolysaccharide/colanic/teichoic acid biosynthesis glycosyltransferase